MQATEDRLGLDLAQFGRLDGPRNRAVLFQPQMSPAAVVVINVLAKDSPQVPPIQDYHVIQALTPNRPDHPLDIWVLPWGSEEGQDLFDLKGGNPAVELVAELAVSISDHESWRGVPGEGLDDLLPCPDRSWALGEIEVQDLAPGVIQDQKDIDHPKTRCGYCEEVDRYGFSGMVYQEGAPGLRWRVFWLDHVFRNRCLADIDAQFEQLAMDVWCAP